MNHHYTRDDLLRAIEGVGIRPGDTVSLQVSLGRLGMPFGVEPNYPALSNFMIDSFLEVLGPQGTLVVPTYTYSIGRGTVFEVETTPSSIGQFPEVFRSRQGVVRSRDPMMSSAAIGPRAAAVLRNISRSCYGEGSTFQRLREVNAHICTLGISLYWATFRHHIEEVAGVPFRFPKSFTGIVRENGRESRETWSYFAAPIVDNCQPNGLPLERRARDTGLVRITPVGRGEIMAIDAGKYFEFGLNELRTNPWLTAKGPPAAAEVIFKDEPQWWAARSANGPLT
ncbi:AAC(3) family N-acetyltransferase [Methylocystis sp. B8]|uniref:AAC(3) family N-acetyltransferase n=1 Tax=Methylocystis sp. B8 TaxID=544938 RepID=UPI0010FDE059|nr:AAC(3) family N-acetyltransferase [Methylocystis sp. B8]TLG77614.1 AAC(3) family N-acetyltransferase [Methylocystis sp. B8]